MGSKGRGKFLRLRNREGFRVADLCWSKVPALLTNIAPIRGLDNARLQNCEKINFKSQSSWYFVMATPAD